MRKLIAVVLFVLLCPTIGLGERRGYHSRPPQHSYAPRLDYHGRHHSDDGWIIPLAIFGGILGVMALSQMAAPPPPAPPQRICRDTYNYYDEYGRYLYSRYVDRPCRD